MEEMYCIRNIVANSTMLLLLLFGGATGLKAQEVIPVAGAEALSNGGSVSFTVGQVTYASNTGVNGSEIQGVQQPYEISILTGVEETKDVELTALAYPNPATDYLYLKVNAATTFRSMGYQLYDVDGRLIENNRIESGQTGIPMTGLVPGAYFLKVTKDNKEAKTFRIVKR